MNRYFQSWLVCMSIGLPACTNIGFKSTVIGPLAPAIPQSAMRISQWGVTWTFDREYPTGQFANGDYWVVGPVRILQITPGTQVISGGREINGSMINPTPGAGNRSNCSQGYDSSLYGGFAYSEVNYFPELNVAKRLPLNILPGSSLISTISQIGPAPNLSFSELKTAAVLTVLSEAPPPNAFRPPYAGTDKTILYREANLQYEVLADLAPAQGAPDITSVSNGFSRVWLDHCGSWVSRYIHPVDNMPDYYQYFTSLTGELGFLLNTNLTRAQKRNGVVRLVQLGIDNYRNISLGFIEACGETGHCNGRKFPIVFAGKLLNDATLLNVGSAYPSVFYGPNDGRSQFGFSEDRQVFYVRMTSPDVYNWGYGGYSAQHAGMAEWGNYHMNWPRHGQYDDNPDWNQNPYRRCCSATAWSYAMVLRIMGLREAWNQPAFFDYMDRYASIQGPDFAHDAWSGRMYLRYQNSY